MANAFTRQYGSIFKGYPRAIIVLVACIVVLAFNASPAQVMNTFLPSIMEHLSVEKVDIAWGNFCMTAVAFVSGFVCMKLIPALGARNSMIVSTLINVVYIVGIAQFTDTLAAYVVFCGIGGFGKSMGTLAAVAGILSLHFGKNGSALFGLVNGGHTLLISGYITMMGILVAGMDYRTALLIIAAMVLVLGLGFNLLFLKAPSEERRKQLEEEAKANVASDEASAHEKLLSIAETAGVTLKEAAHTPALYIFLLGMATIGICTGGFTSYCTMFFREFGMDASQAAYMLSIYIFFNAIHMLYTGFIQRSFGSRVFLFFMYGGTIIGFVLLTIYAGTSLFWVAILGLVFVAVVKVVLSLPALLLGEIFGKKEYVGLNALSNGFYNVGMMISSLSTAAVLQYLGPQVMTVYLCVAAVFSGVCFLIAVAKAPMKKIVAEIEAAEAKESE